MVILKYIRLGIMKYISHIDVLRNMQLAIRRAEIDVKFSQGYNPHELLYFSPPTALGMGSYAEYVVINTDMKGSEVFDRYNKNISKDMQAIRYFEIDKDPKLQAKIVAAEYVFDVEYNKVDIKAQEPFVATFEVKDETVTMDLGSQIYKVFNADGKLGMVIAAGNNNLKVSRILPKLNKDYGLNLILSDVIKTAQFIDLGKGFIELDDALDRKLLN